MHKNLKIALKRRSSEQGFAIPIVMGLGLVMILISTMMILRSQSERVTASAQTATNRALSAAETGITRYQSLINNNRAIATYPDCVGNRDSSGNCPDTNNTTSWANATAIPPAITASAITSCSSGGDVNAVKAASQNIGPQSWQNVSSDSDPSLGQYRLVSYFYPAPGTTGTAGVAPGSGQLTVEGRVNQVGSSTSASSTVGTATTRLQVNIPVQQGNITGIPFPGMWVKSSLSTGNTQANILVPCNSNPSVNLASGYTLLTSNFTMPNPPIKPSPDPNPNPNTPLASNQNKYVNSTISDPGATGASLPLATDIAIHKQDLAASPPNTNNPNSNYNWATGEYQYAVSIITGSFTILGGYKVAIYLDGQVDLTGGQKAIMHSCLDTQNNPISNCSATDARIYGNPNSTQPYFHLGGNASVCSILFFAPNYSVDLNGGGQAQGCGGGANNNGIYWVKSWSGGGQGNHTSLYQTSANWKDINFPSIPLAPNIAPITNWQRQEASP